MPNGMYLVGFMGSGKSFWGRQLAARLGCSFIDLDAMIELETGLSISEIFATKGEGTFRTIEADCLRKIDLGTKPVVATGGGTPCFFDNMEWMNHHGLTIFLDVPVPVLADRLRTDTAPRPLLDGLEGEALTNLIASRLAARRSFYEQARLILSGEQNDNFLEVIIRAIDSFEGE